MLMAAASGRASQRKELERSEEHTSELQSPDHLVCRLLLEKKNLKIDAAERRLQRRHGLDHAVDGVSGDFNVEYVDAGELLEQNRLAVHDRLRYQLPADTKA